MFKSKNKIARISNAILMTVCILSLVSIVSLITTDYSGVEGYTKELHLYNVVIMIVCAIVTGIMLYIFNKKIDLYKEEYTLSRKLFNLFIVFSLISMSMMVAMPIAEYFIYGDFYLYNILYILLGYAPAYLVGYHFVNKKEILNSNNSKKTNVITFFVLYLLMSYYINIITDIIQLLYKLAETKTLLIDIGLSVAWIAVVLVAYRMINKEVKNDITISSRNNNIKDAKIVESKKEEPKKEIEEVKPTKKVVKKSSKTSKATSTKKITTKKSTSKKTATKKTIKK